MNYVFLKIDLPTNTINFNFHKKQLVTMPKQQKIHYCNECKKITVIQRDYNLDILVISLILLIPVAAIYYYTRKKVCRCCRKTDVTEQDLNSQSPE